jgi:GT2 family glycosyltransferase
VATPEFSVIVPTFERLDHLPRLLEALARQEYPRDQFEVLLVNDGGRVPLEPILQRFSGRLQVRLLSTVHAGPGAARNLGLAQARGRLVAFTDDDCEPAAEWLNVLQRTMDHYPGCMAGGRILGGVPDNAYSEASQMISEFVYAFYNADPQNARFFSSNNMAAPASALRELGGFDPRFRHAAEDRDLCERWRHAGHGMVFASGAIVRHHSKLTLRSYSAQHFRYGRGAASFHRVRTALGSSRLEEHTAFHRDWSSWLFRPWRESRGLPAAGMIGLLLLWQLANAAGFLYGLVADRRRGCPPNGGYMRESRP